MTAKNATMQKSLPLQGLSLLSWLGFCLLTSGTIIAAGNPLNVGIAATYSITDDEAVDGDVLCFPANNEGVLIRCRQSYDERMFGILSLNPQVVLRQQSDEQPVTREGKTLVNLRSDGQAIGVGDYLTSSVTPGKAEKSAQASGWIVGRALENWPNADPNDNQILVALDIGPSIVQSKTNLLDYLGLILLSNIKKPEGPALFVRYVTAGLTTLFAVFFAFNNFGRNITKGIEAVGRNPLAKNQILLIFLVNIALISLVTVGAILLSLAIIRL